MTTVTISYIDNSKESTSFSVPIADITAANHDAQLTAVANLYGDLNVLTLAAPTKRTVVHSQVDYAYTVPTDDYANRETAVQFTMQGTTDPKNKVRVSLGAPDLSKFPFSTLQSDIAEAPFSGLDVALSALISQLETMVVHPISGEAVEVVRMEKVGRNL